MRTLYVLLFGLILSFNVVLTAQNDNCANAIEFTSLDDECLMANFNLSPSFDVVNGSCVESVDAPNLWYKFTAEGTQVTLESKGLPSGAYITLGEFTTTACQNANWTELACEENQLQFANLTIGEEYYISINLIEQSEDIQSEICIDNPVVSPPLNDLACEADTIVPDGECLSGTTVAATPEFSSAPGCESQNLESMVWYEVSIGEDNNILNVTMSGINEAGLGIIELSDSCDNIQSNSLIDIACNPPYELNAVVTQGKKYYIFVSSSEDTEGEFEICATESGPPAGCSESDNCASPKEILTPTANEDPECITDCNLGSTQSSFLYPCFDASLTTTFYEFSTDALTNRVTIELQDLAGTMDVVAMALLDECNESIVCEYGNNGSVNIGNATVQPFTNYIIAVATPAASQSEEFEICVNSFKVMDDFCISRNSMADTSFSRIRVLNTSKGSDRSGPYKPGEEVTFELYVPDYSLSTTIQWLQAIIPVFGNGWDPASFSGPNSNGEPIISEGPAPAADAVWNWYAEDENDYNADGMFYSLYQDDLDRLAICYFTEPNCPEEGISLGDGLPAGWYAYSNSSSCEADGDPDNGWGDGKDGPWTVTFTLKTRELLGAEGCSQTNYTDCSVRFYTFSDAQIGCWDNANGNACAGDGYKEHTARIDCIVDGQLFPQDSIILCKEDSITLSLVAAESPEYSYSWTSDPGDFDSDLAEVKVSPEETTTYYVTVSDGMNSLMDSITVEVKERHTILAGDDKEILYGTSTSLSVLANDGSGDYSYFWTPSDKVEDPTVREPITTDLIRPVNFIVEVTDNVSGCLEIDTVKIAIKADSLIVDIDNMPELICKGDSVSLEARPFGGTGEHTFNWQSSPGDLESTDSIFITSPDETTTFYLTVQDQEGNMAVDSVEIEVVDLSYLDLEDEIIYCGDEDSIEVCADAGLNSIYNWSNGITTYNTECVDLTEGEWTLTVEDGNGCMFMDSFLVSQTEPIEVELLMDSTVIISGGTPPYDTLYELNDNILEVNVTDANLCSARDEVMITSIVGELLSDVTVYPNPTSDILIIEAGEIENYQVTLFNQLGQRLITDNNTQRLDVRKYEGGVYYLQISTSGSSDYQSKRIPVVIAK